MEPTEVTTGFCHVCGASGIFRSFEPIDAPCKRNSFLCDSCGSCGRNRHIARTLLALFPIIGGDVDHAADLRDFARRWQGDIWLTCTSGAIHAALSGHPGCIASEFIDDTPVGAHKDGVLCQDLQRSSFPDASFDLIVTEDVMEHVPNPEQALAEIRRVLKPGGYHVATIPVNWSRKVTARRATIANGELVHFLEPEYHGDPTRPEKGILAYTDFAPDMVEAYLSITGPSWMLSAHGDARLEKDFAIYNNWVFVSRRG